MTENTPPNGLRDIACVAMLPAVVARDDTIGDRIRFARREKWLTQPQLAAKGGFTQSQVSDWERGWVTPEIENIAKLAEVLDKSIEFFAEKLRDLPRHRAERKKPVSLKAGAPHVGSVKARVLELERRCDSLEKDVSFLLAHLGSLKQDTQVGTGHRTAQKHKP